MQLLATIDSTFSSVVEIAFRLATNLRIGAG
jgi:hypothetical protein